MDSGNSGCSLQSSSGGDEEYDSRAESISAFFSSTATTGAAASLPHLQPPTPPTHHQNLFDNFSFLDSHSNHLLNLDIPWTSRPPPPPNPSSTDIPTLIPSTAAAPLPRPGITTTTQPQPAAAPRGSKKRSRASRRAPTTVLTTDTSNFRAMVQEFTGIPAPPFASSSSSSPFSRSRFDLFHSSLRSDTSSPPPYLLRPFAQKIQQAMTIPTTTSNASTSNPAPTTNYQLSSTNLVGHDSSSHNQALFNLHNPMLNFHPLLQSSLTPKYSNISMPVLAAAAAAAGKPQAPPIPSDGSYGGDVGGMGLPNLIGMQPRGRGEEISGWSAPPEGSQAQFRPVAVAGISQKPTSCKMNLSATSSEFGADKVSDNAPARGEGMLESWICSSD